MNDSSPAPDAWFLRKDDGVVFGPATLDTLRGWAADGRVAPTDEVSLDRVQWQPAPGIARLGMEWIVESPEAEPYGPVHARALLELGRDGTLPGSVRIRHVRDGRRMTLSSLGISEGVIPPEGEAAPESVPPGPPPSWSGIARERDHLEREAARWKARYESEVSALEASVRTLEEQARAQANEMETLRAERDQGRLEQEQVKRRWDPETGGDDFQAAFSELSACYEILTRQLADRTDRLSELRESLTHAQETHAAKLERLEKELETAHREANAARRSEAQAEESYQQVLRSLRDLNFRFIRLRESNPKTGGVSGVESAEPAPAKPSPAGGRAENRGAGSPRVRLIR